MMGSISPVLSSGTYSLIRDRKVTAEPDDPSTKLRVVLSLSKDEPAEISYEPRDKFGGSTDSANDTPSVLRISPPRTPPPPRISLESLLPVNSVISVGSDSSEGPAENSCSRR